ncbi:MAG: AbrB/MazE/SpoVT family DNA-binding domain-containing protein, partial [Anaerolineae bacterium]
MVIRTHIVRIGNSRGVRIPKPLLDQLGLEDEIELLPGADGLLLRPVKHPRAGWDEQFARMAAEGDDELLDAEAPAATVF